MLRQFNITKRTGRSSTEAPIVGALATRYGLGFHEHSIARTTKDIDILRESVSATAEGASQESATP